MRGKQREHAERLLRHTAAVHECAEQVLILESEYAQRLNEVNCLCPYKYGHGAAVRPQTNDAIWDGVIRFVGQGRIPLVTLVCKREYANGGEPEPVFAGSGSHIRWHSDNEPLFGPQNSPKLIVSLSLGNSVEFKVRRASGEVPSSITLDHGDFWSWMV